MRPGALGDPFPMGRDEGRRDPVCAAHAAAPHHAMSGIAPDLYAIGSECGAIAVPLYGDPWGAAQRVHELRRMARNPRGEGVPLRARPGQLPPPDPAGVDRSARALGPGSLPRDRTSRDTRGLAASAAWDEPRHGAQHVGRGERAR